MAKSSQVHLIFGNDDYEISLAGKKLVDKFCPPADRDFGLEIIQAQAGNASEAAAAVQGCVEALQTIGLFGGEKTAWLKDANFFSDTKTGKAVDTKTAILRLTELIKKGLSEDQRLIVTAGKVDKRSAFYKACVANGVTQEFALPDKHFKADAQGLARAKTFFKDNGVRISDRVLHAFMGRVGPLSRNIVNEGDKLLTYIGAAKEASLKDVEAVTCITRESPSWDLTEAIGKKDVREMMRVIRLFSSQQVPPISIIFGLESYLKQLTLMRDCHDRGWCSLSSRGRYSEILWADRPEVDACLGSLEDDPRSLNSYRAMKILEQSLNFTATELKELRTRVLSTHASMVSSGIPQQLLLELLLLEVGGQRVV